MLETVVHQLMTKNSTTGEVCAMKWKTIPRLRSVATIGLILVFVPFVACSSAELDLFVSGSMDYPIEPSSVLPVSSGLLERGKETYLKHCAACHAANGDGEGEAAYLLYPRPRDFTRGQFRLVSTWDNVPTNEDLFRTISRGMPGSAMPSWAHLPEDIRWGLVHYVKAFSRNSLAVREAHDPASLQ